MIVIGDFLDQAVMNQALAQVDQLTRQGPIELMRKLFGRDDILVALRQYATKIFSPTRRDGSRDSHQVLGGDPMF